MVLTAALMHPVSLRLIAGRFRYADRVVPCDAIFVPRFEEDKNGEIYMEAFREFWAGNGKVVWIENDRVFGFTMKEIVETMAKSRGIKENAIKALDVEGDGAAEPAKVKEMLARHGVRKVLIVVPAYASRRFHVLYGAENAETGKEGLFLVKPVDVPYFKADKWWKSDVSRALMEHEVYELGLHYMHHFRGEKKQSGTEG
jgi:hypothetical protein